ncbi:DUF4097 family beta strand repeat protein [Clostridium tertium]|uniref:DUF4097 domain-containing protein n=1 Tax=Clostridium tertium TaxID=1559 RepID=A0A6N3G9L7_9CLOT
MEKRKIISNKMKIFMAFLLLSSIICFTTAFIQLYYSDFKIDNYFDVSQYYNNTLSLGMDSNVLNGDEIYSKSIDLKDIDTVNINFDNYTTIVQSYPGDNLSISIYSKYNSSSAQNKQIELLSNSIDNKVLKVTPSQNILSVNEYRNNISFLIKIPYSYSNSVNINNSNGNIDLTNLNLKNLNIKSTNSDVLINNLNAESTTISTTSGNIVTNGLNSKELALNTTDGSISSTDNFSNSSISTINGYISALISSNLSNLTINSTSGDVNLSIEKDSNLTLTYSTINGSLYRDSSDNNSDYVDTDTTLTFGNGSGKVNIKTVHGDLNISE